MEILINELSLEGQFVDNADFFKYFREQMIPLLMLIKDRELSLLKKYDFYNECYSKDKTLSDLLKTKGNPEVNFFKSYMHSIISNPYWQDNQLHDEKDSFSCEYTDLKTGYSLAEACERDKVVLSFYNNKFTLECLEVYKNTKKLNLVNCFEVEILLKKLLMEQLITPILYLESILKKQNRKIAFIRQNGKYALMELLDDRTITEEDRIKIIDKILILTEKINKKDSLNEPLVKHFDKYSELRITVSDDKRIRIFFFVDDSTLIVLHGFIKKTQKTPDSEKEKAKKLKKLYKKS